MLLRAFSFREFDPENIFWTEIYVTPNHRSAERSLIEANKTFQSFRVFKVHPKQNVVKSATFVRIALKYSVFQRFKQNTHKPNRTAMYPGAACLFPPSKSTGSDFPREDAAAAASVCVCGLNRNENRSTIESNLVRVGGSGKTTTTATALHGSSWKCGFVITEPGPAEASPQYYLLPGFGFHLLGIWNSWNLITAIWFFKFDYHHANVKFD